MPRPAHHLRAPRALVRPRATIGSWIAAPRPGGSNAPNRSPRRRQFPGPGIPGSRRSSGLLHLGSGSLRPDVDGNTYVDLVGQWGPALLGHAHPAVVEAAQRAAAAGLGFGAPHPNEVELAELIVERVDPVDQVRLVAPAPRPR